MTARPPKVVWMIIDALGYFTWRRTLRDARVVIRELEERDPDVTGLPSRKPHTLHRYVLDDETKPTKKGKRK